MPRVDVTYLVLLSAVGLVFGVYIALAASQHPRPMSLALIPFLVWPSVPNVGGVPAPAVLAVLVFAGVMVSGGPKTDRKLVLATGALVALVLASVVLHAPTRLLMPSEVRNSAIALVVGLLLVLTYAKAQPGTRATLKVLALSLSAGSVYLAVTGAVTAGRLATETVNSNAAGYAAAAGVLSSLTVAYAAGRRDLRWLVLVPPCFYVVYLSQSRGALTALVVALAVWVACQSHGPRRLVTVIFGILATVLLWGPLAAFASDTLLATRSAAFVESDSRRELLSLAWRSVSANPFGIGYGHFRNLSSPYFGTPLNTHNDWVRIAVEIGVPAAALAIYVLLGRIRVGGDPRLRAMVALSGTAVFFSNTLTDYRVSAPLLIAAGLLWSREPNAAPLGRSLSGRPRQRRRAPAAARRWTRPGSVSLRVAGTRTTSMTHRRSGQ